MLRRLQPRSLMQCWQLVSRAAPGAAQDLQSPGHSSACSEQACSTSYSYSTSIKLPKVNPSRSPPWTPTRQLDKRKVYPKRMRHLMEVRHRCFLQPAAFIQLLYSFS